MEYFCQINGVEMEIIYHTEYRKEKEQEWMDDFIPILPVFANRRYG